MTGFDVFRFAFAAVFAGLHAGLMAGLFREWRHDRKLRSRRAFAGKSGAPEDPPQTDAAAGQNPDPRFSGANTVSVLVPVRNEEAHLTGLLESLARQDYPQAEFIFIDDGSTDKSPELLKRFAASHPAVKIITLAENPGPNRKQYALTRGIEAARGSLFLFTDADCELPPGWIGAMTARMAGDGTALVIGPVFKKAYPAGDARPGPARTITIARTIGEKFFRQYQCFDHAVRYMYLAASTGLGAAGGGFGNNLIVRRTALDRIGGYGKVPPSATEDAALVSLIRACDRAPKAAGPSKDTAARDGEADGGKVPGMAVHAACGRDLWVFTKNEPAWKALVNQTLRWNNGGLFSPDLSTRLNFGFLMVTISLGMLAIPILPFIPGLWPLPAAVLFSMTMNTIAILRLFGPALPKGGIGYIVQIVFTPAYFTFLTILGFCGIKADWKGRHMG
ncbi:MAG: glycosyltransferase [Treponema sp.]|nr:glycosyltransferase [Treponema sp.]